MQNIFSDDPDDSLSDDDVSHEYLDTRYPLLTIYPSFGPNIQYWPPHDTLAIPIFILSIRLSYPGAPYCLHQLSLAWAVDYPAESNNMFS